MNEVPTKVGVKIIMSDFSYSLFSQVVLTILKYTSHFWPGTLTDTFSLQYADILTPILVIIKLLFTTYQHLSFLS